MTEEPRLRVVSSDVTPEEVAAITAAVTLVLRRQEMAQRAAATEARDRRAGDDPLDHWVRAGRHASRSLGYQRGTWRLSGRLGRRHRA